MEFDWSQRKVGEWRAFLKRAPRSNCMQTWPFAKAVRASDQKSTRLALIKTEDESIGFMAVQEVRLGPIHFVHLYRGPIWFCKSPPKKWLVDFAHAFNKEFPKRLFRRRRWLPEWEGEPTDFLGIGFRPKKHQGYRTLWIDLDLELPEIRRRLKQKWRNALNKAEKSNLLAQPDWQGRSLNEFVRQYQNDRLQKKYHGPSGKFVREEFLAAKPFSDGFLLWAYKDKRPIAAVFILLHGCCASYRIGWTTDEGRKYNAHNFLLWKSIEILKEHNIRAFDLGGIYEKENDGLTKFKDGMGGEEFITPGMLA